MQTFMEPVESKFLQTVTFQPLVWSRYMCHIFFISELMAKIILKNFMMEFDNFNPNIKFNYEFSEGSISFLDLNVKFSDGKLQNSLYMKPTDHQQ